MSETGWVLLGSPTRGKYHYVGSDGRALCRKWLAFDWQPREQGNEDSPDNCAECKRRRAAAISQQDTDRAAR